MILNLTILNYLVIPVGSSHCLLLGVTIGQHLVVSGARPGAGTIIHIGFLPSLDRAIHVDNLLLAIAGRFDGVRHRDTVTTRLRDLTELRV